MTVLKIRFSFELNKGYNEELIKIAVDERVPAEREIDAVVYLRERVNEEFRRCTGSPALNALKGPVFDPAHPDSIVHELGQPFHEPFQSIGIEDDSEHL
jgi:hypothetical protein